jgi:predicted PurR-regulated permease PerM
VTLYIGLLIIGVPNALVLALVAGFFELIPFGLILAIVPAVSFAYLHGGISLALIVCGFYLIVQQFENYFIQPLVVRRVIGISPLVVILSLLIGAKLAGFWGLVLAMPIAVALMEYLSDVEKKKIELLES